MKLSALAVAVFAFLAGPSQASVVINATQVGGNVEFSYSGSLDTSTLEAGGIDSVSPRIVLNSSLGAVLAQNGPLLRFVGGPLPTFGNGGTFSGSMTGQGFAVYSNSIIGIFQDYVSGSQFSGKAAFAGTFSSLGLFAGTYMTQLSNSETITLNIAAVPVPAAGFMLASALGCLAFARRRKRLI